MNNPLLEISAALHKAIPGLESGLDEAGDPETGESWLDLRVGEQLISVVWSPCRGLGISTGSWTVYETKPDELCESVDHVLSRVIELFGGTG